MRPILVLSLVPKLNKSVEKTVIPLGEAEPLLEKNRNPVESDVFVEEINAPLEAPVESSPSATVGAPALAVEDVEEIAQQTPVNENIRELNNQTYIYTMLKM